MQLRRWKTTSRRWKITRRRWKTISTRWKTSSITWKTTCKKEKQLEILERIINEKLTVKETEQIINESEISEEERKYTYRTFIMLFLMTVFITTLDCLYSGNLIYYYGTLPFISIIRDRLFNIKNKY